MANYVLPIVARTRRGFPAWVDDQIALDHKIALARDASINAITKGSLLLIGSRNNFWSYFPIASGLPANNVDVLLRLSKRSLGNESYINTGGAIMLSPTKDTGVNHGYALSIGSGTSSYCSIYNRKLSGDQDQLGVAGISPDIANKSTVILIRARRDSDNLRMKVWVDRVEEPVGWSLSIKDTTYDVTNIGFIIHGSDLIIDLKDIAYATNGDTATFDLPPVVDVMAGTVTNVKNGDIVNIHDLATHNIVDSIVLPSSGAWTSNLYNNRPVYARVERVSGSEYDFLFAKYGNTYLGGDYPDGFLKDDGVPSAGEVSVLYRSDDPILGGATIAKVSAPQSGEWRVSGLQPNVPFDVVARKPNRKDVVISSVMGVPDPDFKFALLGQLGNSNAHLTGLVLAKGSAQPITASFLGTTPYGLQSSELAINGNQISANIPLRDYGDFSFDMRVTDANNKFVDSKVDITNGQRASFVSVVSGSKDPISIGSSTSGTLDLNLPTGLQVDDIIVVCIMRREKSGVTITDSNGDWTLAVSSPATGYNYAQWNDIYWRYAKADDADRTISISRSSYTIGQALAFRGDFEKLRVSNTMSFKDRYDNSYSQSEKSLAPITHTSGYLVRFVSNVYASSSNPTMILNNMSMLSPQSAATARVQVGVKHLSSPGVFDGTTYTTGASNSADAIPNVAIILDEIRP